MRLIASILLISILTVLLTVSGFQALAQSEENQEPLKVATKEIKPFVFVVDGKVSGFSIDLWNALAVEAGLEFEYVIVTTVQEQLDAVQNNDADIAIAAISITEEREKSVDFSHEYFVSGLGILTNINVPHNLRDALLAATSPTVLRILAGLIITIIIAAHIIWLLERQRNPAYPSSYIRGVWESIWWSAVTVTTVGYGDKIPVGRFGRIFSILWMLTGLFLIANFTANVTSELTFQRIQGVINGPEDLYGKHVTTVAGTTADEWLTNRGINHTTVTNIEDAYALLDSEDVQAVVYDYPVLLYQAVQNLDKNYTVPGEPFSTEDYGIVFPEGSPFRESVNRALLRLYENGVYDQIYNKWYGVAFDQ
jgi:ABC-type amino acid transport substrate-binding protein